MLDKVIKFFGGDLFKEIKEGVMSYFPPDMTPQQRAEAELKIQELLHRKEIESNNVIKDASAALDSRNKEHEGTASDLKTIPVIGSLVIFLRGLQRPMWGFFTMYIDFKWFTTSSINYTEQQQTALIVINLLVLGFLFGERTVKNLEPLIIKVFAKE